MVVAPSSTGSRRDAAELVSLITEEREHAQAQVLAAEEGDVRAVAGEEARHTQKQVAQVSEATDVLAGYLRHIGSVVEATRDGLSPEETAAFIARTAAEGSGASAASFLLLRGSRLCLLTGWNLTDEVMQTYSEVPLDAKAPITEAIRRRAGVFVETRDALLADYPLTEVAVHAVGAHAWASVPLLVQDRLVGAMSFIFRAPRTFTEPDRAFLAALGGICAQAFDRALAHRTLGLRARQQAAVADLGLLAVSSTDLDQVFRRATEEVARVLDNEMCKVLELLPGGQALLLRAGVGWAPGLEGAATVDTGLDSQAGYTLASEQPIVVEDLSTEQRFRGPALLRDHGVVSGLSCIIRGREGPWGVLGTHTRTRRTFTEDDVHFLEGVANVLANAIERRRYEEDLAMANERLREAERLRLHFFGAVAHDLRTPLTPMALQVQMLRSALPEPHQRHVDVLERSLHRLARLVDDLLDVARLQSGRLPLNRERIDLREPVGEAVRLFTPSAAEKGVRVEARLAKGLLVDADAQRIAQVLTNLLSNAVKFTPHGGRISVEAGQEGDVVVVRVTDTGLGFRPGDLPRLFQPFSQVQEAGAATKGTGLGLYISKGIIEQHGGHIWAHSPGPGQGATFTFTVPRAPR